MESNETVCSECGRRITREAAIKFGEKNICPSCKTAFFQKLKEGSSVSSSMEYASISARFGAKFIDSIITYILSMVISVLAAMVMTSGNEVAKVLTIFSLQMVLQVLYATYFIGRFQATPGKMAVGIIVVRPDGDDISYSRAMGRYFSEFISGIILGIGYIMAAFDDEKRALHDRICDTRVIKKA